MAPEPRVSLAHVRTLLRWIQRKPGISKPELARYTGLMPSAVHGAVTWLEQAELIACIGMAESSGGRRAARYGLRGEVGHVIGVSLRIDQLEVGIFDLALRRLHTSGKTILLGEEGPESYVLMIAEAVRALLAEASLRLEDCLGVGVNLPGPVEPETGTVYELSATPLWQQFPLARRLGEDLGLPVRVDKDVFSALHYLQLTGHMRSEVCSAYLSICEGIGSALMIDGQVFRGGHSLAGEIGHLTVRKDGIPCTCGNTGCLELYCSDIGIVRQYNAQNAGRCTRIEEVLALMEEGDAFAERVFAQAISYLVDTTCSVIMNYDPEELFIYCRWLNRHKPLYFRMLDALYAKSIFTKKHSVDIRLLGQEPINLVSAAGLATEFLYTPAFLRGRGLS